MLCRSNTAAASKLSDDAQGIEVGYSECKIPQRSTQALRCLMATSSMLQGAAVGKTQEKAPRLRLHILHLPPRSCACPSAACHAFTRLHAWRRSLPWLPHNSPATCPPVRVAITPQHITIGAPQTTTSSEGFSAAHRAQRVPLHRHTQQVPLHRLSSGKQYQCRQLHALQYHQHMAVPTHSSWPPQQQQPHPPVAGSAHAHRCPLPRP